MKKREYYISAADETTKIHTIEWFPESEPKAIFQVFHDMAESMLHYEELAEFFTGRGFAIIGNEPPAGNSSQRVQENIHTCLKMTKNKYPDVPHLLMGLSEEVHAVCSFLSKYSGIVEGAVLSGFEQKNQEAKDIPVLHISGEEENRPELFRRICHWTEERLDEMLYRAATKQ